MHNGYYTEQDNLVSDGSLDPHDPGFEFMEDLDYFSDPDIVEAVNMHDFLHGYCDVFAMMLSESFGYDIYAVLGPGAVMHAYCMRHGLYIDARGITDDPTEFWREMGYASEPDNVLCFQSISEFEEALEEYGAGESSCPYSKDDLRMIADDPVFRTTYDTSCF